MFVQSKRNIKFCSFYFASVLSILILEETFAQQNVRAWYAQGQVWVVWQAQAPLAETIGVFKSSTTFNNVNQATPIGRLFQYEYLPGSFIQQTGNTAFTYKIPKPDGSLYTLAMGEGLFVETVTNTGSAYYAVVEWGKTTVLAGVNNLKCYTLYLRPGQRAGQLSFATDHYSVDGP